MTSLKLGSVRSLGIFAIAATVFVGLGMHQAYAAFVEKTRPAVVFTNNASGIFTATISATDASGIKSLVVNLHVPELPGGVKACGSLRNLTGLDGKTYTCTIDTTKIPDGLYELKGSAADANGNVKAISQWLNVVNGNTGTSSSST